MALVANHSCKQRLDAKPANKSPAQHVTAENAHAQSGTDGFASAPVERQAWSLPHGVEASIDTLARASSAIDELIERNRTITDAAVRSVEHFRARAREAEAERLRLQEEIETLRVEREILRAEREAMRVAADALRADCEAEIESQRRELELTHANIQRFNTQMADLLGAAEQSLSDTNDASPRF